MNCPPKDALIALAILLGIASVPATVIFASYMLTPDCRDGFVSYKGICVAGYRP